MRGRLIVALLVLATLLAPPAVALAQQATPIPKANGAHGDFQAKVDIGGRSLSLVCMGEGGPTVILESGSPFMAATDWLGMQTRVAAYTRVCSYDRANVGYSGPAPTPRTVKQMADDLHALLGAAGVPGPYVLAAGSFGPLVSRLYASTYPAEVVGLVFIDPQHEDLDARWAAALPEAQRARFAEVSWSGNPEKIALEESYAQVRASGPLPAVPLIVLVHGDVRRDHFLIQPGWPIEVLDPIFLELAAQQAKLVPGGRLIVAEKSGHDIMSKQPDLVDESVRQVVEAARTGAQQLPAVPGAAEEASPNTLPATGRAEGSVSLAATILAGLGGLLLASGVAVRRRGERTTSRSTSGVQT